MSFFSKNTPYGDRKKQLNSNLKNLKLSKMIWLIKSLSLLMIIFQTSKTRATLNRDKKCFSTLRTNQNYLAQLKRTKLSSNKFSNLTQKQGTKNSKSGLIQ
jgi:hypothetical protein